MKEIDTGIKQLGEKFTVHVEVDKGRIAVIAINEGGASCTSFPLMDLLQWAAKNCPRLVIRALKEADEWSPEEWNLNEIRGDEPYVLNQTDPFEGWNAT